MEELTFLQQLVPGVPPMTLLLLWFVLKDKFKKPYKGEERRSNDMCLAHEQELALVRQDRVERKQEMEDIKKNQQLMREEMLKGFSRIHERIDRLLEGRHDSR